MAQQAAIAIPSIAEQRNSVVKLGLMADPTKPPAGTDPKQIQYLNQLWALQDRSRAMGSQPVTLVNMNPYDLVVCDPLFDGLIVKAVKDGESYSALVISENKYQVDTGLDHNHTPVEYWPVLLALEFMNQYRDKGGVFFINGDLQANPELSRTTEFKQKFRASQEQLYQFAFKMKLQADAEWNRPNRSGRSNIHAQHRMMARILFNAKKIGKLPDWEDVLIPTEDILPNCPVCQSEPKKGALICPTCAYTLDPAGAFKLGVIEPQNNAMERLTRAEVKKLGISAYVAETSDEMPARLEKGLAKPLSAFEMNQLIEHGAQQADTSKGGK